MILFSAKLVTAALSCPTKVLYSSKSPVRVTSSLQSGSRVLNQQTLAMCHTFE